VVTEEPVTKPKQHPNIWPRRSHAGTMGSFPPWADVCCQPTSSFHPALELLTCTCRLHYTPAMKEIWKERWHGFIEGGKSRKWPMKHYTFCTISDFFQEGNSISYLGTIANRDHLMLLVQFWWTSSPTAKASCNQCC